MKINVKKTVIVALDVLLAAYLVLAMTSWNRPDETMKACTNVRIVIDDDQPNGFLSAKEIKHILEKKKIYPYEKPMATVNPRTIEDALKKSSFVNTSECYKTKDGHVVIKVTQRQPVVRIKNITGDDYYVDDKGGVMPNSQYTSDLMICTGNVTRAFAQRYVAPLAIALMENELWRNQVEQINVLPDMGIELVPRVGEHVIYVGHLPQSNNAEARQTQVADFIAKKLNRLEKFYKFGLSKAGWNKYSYINLEYDNQIVCKRRKHVAAAPAPEAPAATAQTTPSAPQ